MKKVKNIEEYKYIVKHDIACGTETYVTNNPIRFIINYLIVKRKKTKQNELVIKAYNISPEITVKCYNINEEKQNDNQ